MADGKRWVLEGRLVSVALQALRMGTGVVLDYGWWGRDERSALRWLAPSAGQDARAGLYNRPPPATIQRTDRIFVTKTEPAAVAAATVPNRTG